MIYLNNAATSYPKPSLVIKSLENSLNLVPFHSGRSNQLKQDVVVSCREKLAKFFGVSNPKNIIFTSNSTESLNIAISGLDLKNGHVITTSTEHNSVIRPLKHLELESLELTIVECDKYGQIDINLIRNSIKSNTKAIIVNHCSNVTGMFLDIKSISQIAHENNLVFIVDASQSAGCVPINVENDGIDILEIGRASCRERV